MSAIVGGEAESLEPQIRSDGFARHRYISAAKVGPYRPRAVRVVGVNPDGRYATESIAAGAVRQGLRKTFQAAALRKSGKAPLKERYAQTRRGISVGGRSGDSDDENGPIIYPNDVYIDGIPMVNQGKNAYCAAAAAARVLQGYGIEVGGSAFAGFKHGDEHYGVTLDLSGVRKIGDCAFSDAGYNYLLRFKDNFDGLGNVTLKFSEQLQEVSANPSLTTAPTRTGLFYQLREGELLDGMKDGDSKVGDGEPWSPKITVKGGNAAFYSIGVEKGK